MSARYKRVPQQEAVEPPQSVDDPEAECEKAASNNSDFTSRLQVKLTALLWVIGAASLFVFTDVVGLVSNDKRIARCATLLLCFYNLRMFRWYLNVSVVCFSMDIVIMLYLTLYLPLICKVYTPWEIYCPRMIPTATLCGAIGGLSLMIAFWPIWGLLTPLILTIYFVGIVFATHFIPWPC